MMILQRHVLAGKRFFPCSIILPGIRTQRRRRRQILVRRHAERRQPLRKRVVRQRRRVVVRRHRNVVWNEINLPLLIFAFEEFSF